MHSQEATRIFTEALKAYMKDNAVGATAVAAEIGAHRVTVQRWVSGTASPSSRMREKASSRLGIAVSARGTRGPDPLVMASPIDFTGIAARYKAAKARGDTSLGDLRDFILLRLAKRLHAMLCSADCGLRRVTYYEECGGRGVLGVSSYRVPAEFAIELREVGTALGFCLRMVVDAAEKGVVIAQGLLGEPGVRWVAAYISRSFGKGGR